MNTQPKPSEIVIMASGAVAFIFSFFTWFDFPGQAYNAWNTDLTFPLATYIGIFGLLMGIQVALARFANVQMPDRVVGFTWPQIHLVLAVFCGLLAIGWLIVGEEYAIGFWLSFLAAIGLIVGAVMLHTESAAATADTAGSRPATPPPAGPGTPPPAGPSTPPPGPGGTPPPSPPPGGPGY
ncbi:MAG TPA: hypothetical protein VFZ68_12145 [Acidimicrobiales bacterium]